MNYSNLFPFVMWFIFRLNDIRDSLTKSQYQQQEKNARFKSSVLINCTVFAETAQVKYKIIEKQKLETMYLLQQLQCGNAMWKEFH